MIALRYVQSYFQVKSNFQREDERNRFIKFSITINSTWSEINKSLIAITPSNIELNTLT